VLALGPARTPLRDLTVVAAHKAVACGVADRLNGGWC
jgi:hypothetical protein